MLSEVNMLSENPVSKDGEKKKKRRTRATHRH